MSLLCVAVCALCIVSGFGYDIGPLNCTVVIGSMYPKHELTPEDIHASYNLNGLLELVRRLMPVGVDDAVPPLEPYVKVELPPAQFNNPNSDLKGRVELSNLVASGAQGFHLNYIEVRNADQRIDFEVVVPQVVADIDYITLNFMYKQHVFNTSGHVQLILENLRIKGAISFATLTNENFDYFVPIGMQADNDAVNVQIGKNIAEIPLDVVDEVKDELLWAIGEAALEQITDITMRFSVKQVMQFLYGNTLS